MKNRNNSTGRIIRRTIVAVSLVILIVAGVSCDLIFPKSGPNINKLIETWWGVDVTNSGQVAGAILGMQLMGNKEAADGLTAYSHCRSELYQERGEELYDQGKTDDARQQYAQAIDWAPTDTPHRASDKASIYYAFANTYMKDAFYQPNVPDKWPFYRAAGQNMILAANTEPSPEIKAFYYREAAFHLAIGGDRKTAKKAYEQAANLEPDSIELERISGYIID